MMEKTERWRGRQQRMRWLDSITDSVDMTRQSRGDGEGQGGLACMLQRVGHDLATEHHQQQLL